METALLGELEHDIETRVKPMLLMHTPVHSFAGETAPEWLIGCF